MAAVVVVVVVVVVPEPEPLVVLAVSSSSSSSPPQPTRAAAARPATPMALPRSSVRRLVTLPNNVVQSRLSSLYSFM
ncbi:MAG: hypothetical protein F4X26_10235 [Chloroflexi bacterium]|nr:hypothetical protein [Chloroflexota bacterium]